MSFYLLKKERYLDFGLCVIFGMLLMFVILTMSKKKGKKSVKTHLSSVRSYLSKLSDSIRNKAKTTVKKMKKHKDNHVKAHNSIPKVLSISKNNVMTLSEELERDNELDDYYRLYTPTISTTRY